MKTSMLLAAIAAVCVALPLMGCGPKAAEPTAQPAPESKTESKAASTPVVPEPPKPLEMTTPVSLTAPGLGVLITRAPSGSRVEPVVSKPGEPVSTKITVTGSVPIEIRVTVLGLCGLTPDFGSDASLKYELAKWAETIRGKTVEPDLSPALVTSARVWGFYLAATDANPAPGQPRKVFNGFFRAGDCVFMLGGLHSDDSGVAMETLLDMVKSALWEGASQTPA